MAQADLVHEAVGVAVQHNGQSQTLADAATSQANFDGMPYLDNRLCTPTAGFKFQVCPSYVNLVT